MNANEPTATTEREVVLDVVRGFALFGVLTVNAMTAFRVSLFEQFLPAVLLPEDAQARMSPLDAFLGRAVTVAVEMKAFILFAFLFGVGLAAQRERAVSDSYARFMARRLVFLLGIGLAHLVVVWNGDILTFYAVIAALGAIVIGVVRSPRALLALAIVLFIVHVLPIPYPPLFASVDAIREHVDAARHVYPHGSFGQVLAFRVREIPPIVVLWLWSTPRTLGMFLLGAAAWRARAFREERRGLATHMAIAGITLGGAAMFVVHAGVVTVTGRLHDVIDTWGSILLSLGYGSAIVTLFYTRGAHRFVSLLAPLGRMALTSYLTQSIVLGVVFYGYGLGKFGDLSSSATMALVIALYLAQIALARIWLARFRFGPVEWLWRSFSYGAWQPFVAGGD